MAATITLSNVECANLSTADPLVPTVGDGQVTGSIGAEFELRFRATIGGTDQIGLDVDTWAGRSLVFNPAMFLPIGTVGGPSATIGWSVQYGGTVASFAVMSLVGCGSYTEANRNYSCTATKHADDAIDVKFRFRVTMDLNGWIAGLNITNRSRLLRARITDTSDLVNTGTSVFTGGNTGIVFAVTAIGVNLGKVRAMETFPFVARFYDSFLTGGPGNAEIDTPTVAALDDADVPVGNLSVYEDRTVRFVWPKTVSWDVAPDCEVILMRVSVPVNTGQNYLEQYAPGGYTTVVGGITDETTHWQLLFPVSPADVIVNELYRVAVVVKVVDTADSNNVLSNSFISPLYAADGSPTPLDLTVTGTLKDYQTDPETDNIITTVVDHIRSIVTIDAEAYNAAAAPWATTFAEDLMNVRLEFIDTGDSSVLDYRTWYKDGDGNWVGISGSHPNNITLLTAGDVTTITFEAGVAFLNMVDFPDFGDKNVQWKWTYTCKYPAIDLAVDYVYRQAMSVRNFEGDGAGPIESIELFDYATGQVVQSLCDTDVVLVKVTLDDAFVTEGDTWFLRVYFNVEGYGYTDPLKLRPFDGAFEEDGGASPTGFEQLDDDHFLNVPATFTDGVAVFQFQHADIPAGERVRLYVIAQKETPACLEPDLMAPAATTSLVNWYFNSVLFVTYPDLDTLNGFVGAENQIAFVQADGNFRYYNIETETWDLASEDVWPVIATEEGVCFTGALGEGNIECSTPLLTSPATSGSLHRISYAITGTGTGLIYFPGTFPECGWTAPEDDGRCEQMPAFSTSQVYFKADAGFVGCITFLLVQKLC